MSNETYDSSKPLLERGGGAESDLAASRARCEELEKELESHVWEISPAMAQAKIDELNAKVASLASENAKLREDKERLDWLDGQKIEGVTMAQPRWCWRVRSGPSVSETGEQHSSIRAAIDEARADAARKEPPAKAHGCEVGE